MKLLQKTSALVAALVLMVGAAFAVNAPTAFQTPSKPDSPPIAAVTPQPGTGFSPRTPVDLQPEKFGTLTTSTLPVENGKRLVGKVNGRPITWEEFIVAFKIAGAALNKQYPDKQDGVMAAISAPVFDSLVLTELYRDFAEENNLAVSAGETSRKVEELKHQTAGPEREALARLTNEQVHLLAKDTLIREKVEKFVGDRATSVPPTLDEITSISVLAVVNLTTAPEETLRARHIVVRATPDMSDFDANDAKARAEEILEKVRGGLDFYTAARQYSQDRFTAYLGGNVGYFTRGTMFEAFEDAAFALQPGEVSGVVRTPVGYHIIQVTERHPDNLRIIIDDLRRQQAVDQWRNRAVQSAKVEKFL